MRVFLIITASILLLGAGYFTYQKWAKDSDLTTWSFVPATSAIVYESYQSYDILRTLKERTIWSTVSTLDGFDRIEKTRDSLDIITGGQLSSILNQQHLLVSVHPVSRNYMDFLFVLEINSIDARTQLSNIRRYFEKKFTTKIRTYLDYELVEISGQNRTFTFTFQKNYLVGSFSAFLVEDAIRTALGRSRTFRDSFPELQDAAKLQQDQGNLYFNINSFLDLADNYARLEDFSLGSSAFLDIQVADQTIQLNGFTFPSDLTSVLSPHINVTPGSFNLSSITPLQTSYLFHYSFNDVGLWSENYKKYLLDNQPGIQSRSEKLKTTADLNIDYVYSLLDQEIGLLHFEGLSNTDKALILEVKDSGSATDYFDDIARQFSQSEGDSILSETYQGIELKLMMAEEFPSTILGNIAEGFPSSYYFTIDNFMVFSNSIQQLQRIIDAINEENTWAKSLRKNEFLRRINQSSNFSVFVNTPEFWSRLNRKISPVWKPFFNKNSTLIKSIDNIAIQFSQVDGTFFTNIVFDQSEAPVTTTPAPEPIKSVVLKSKIVTKPYLVKNYSSEEMEILVQDSSNALYLLDENLQILWEQSINAKISSDISQIDFYKNNKLQYVFVASDQIHIIDRNGEYLPEFPKSVSDLSIVNFAIIDYNGSRNYRFSFSDGKGNIYLTDKNGKQLDGWNPNSIGDPIIQPLRHLRVANRDVLIAISKNGKVHLRNRKGRSIPPFPIDFQLDINNPLHLTPGSNFNNTALSFVSTEGEWIEVDFTGNTRKREQLYKSTSATKFYILNDIKEENQLLTTQDAQGLRFLDPQGNLLFEKIYLGGISISTQFYRITAGKELVIVRDVENERVSVFNLEGHLLTGGPFEASQDISAIYSSKEDVVTMFVNFNNEIRKLQLANF